MYSDKINKDKLKSIFEKILDCNNSPSVIATSCFDKSLISSVGLTTNQGYLEMIKMVTCSIDPNNQNNCYLTIHREDLSDFPDVNNIDEYLYNLETFELKKLLPNEIDEHHRPNFTTIPQNAKKIEIDCFKNIEFYIC